VAHLTSQVGFFCSCTAVRPQTHEERLLAFLFDEQEYKSVARAVMDTSKTVTVAIDFVLLRIHGLVGTSLLID